MKKLLLALAAVALPAFAGETLLNSFETAAEIAMLRPSNAKIATVDSGASEGRQALRIDFQPAQWPNVLFRRGDPWDFRQAGELAFEATNPGSDAITFSVRIDDDLSADGTNHCRTAPVSIEAGATHTVAFRFSGVAMDYGMRALPTYPNTRVMLEPDTRMQLDFSHIVQFQIFLSGPTSVKTLIVDNVRLRPAYSLDGILDQYGQFTGADWPGKLTAAAEFAERRVTEAAELAATAPPAGRDKFGGWASGPKREASGFFRTEQLNGKWWLVTPEGTLFFSTGFDSVRPHAENFITGRERMFTWLPDASDPLARYYGTSYGATLGPISTGRTFDFYAANIERKYGRDSEAWVDATLKRIRSWGFNTIGNWSDPITWGKGVPYVTSSDTSGTYNHVPSSTDLKVTVPDPFDPEFAKAVAGHVAYLSGTAADAWLLGHFVDNELRWGDNSSDGGRYAIARNALGQPNGPARAAFIEELRGKYSDVAELNRAWGTHFATWADIAPPAAFTAAMRADMGAFITNFARMYFRTVRDAIRARDPNHLYLGCRFAWYTTEAVNAAAEIVDVVSFNIYKTRIDSSWDFLNALGKPVIIGEFHFGALDRGMFHPGLVAAPDQDGRGAMFIGYMHSVLDHPALVGAHWFEYADEPATGRWLDGENYQIGFVNVTDTPYPEIVAAGRALNAEVYPRRFGASGENLRRRRVPLQ